MTTLHILSLNFYDFCRIFFSVECTNNKYGQDCRQSCGNCTKGEPCNHVNGSCPNGCVAGVTGENCKTGKLVPNKVFEIHTC